MPCGEGKHKELQQAKDDMNHECPQEQEDLLSQTSLRFNLLSLICIFYLWQLDACSYLTDIVYAYVVSHFN